MSDEKRKKATRKCLVCECAGSAAVYDNEEHAILVVTLIELRERETGESPQTRICAEHRAIIERAKEIANEERRAEAGQVLN
jgi:hypothetical protein